MEKKNKKKLFAIIGGSVLAFVLTIALSVSITLAYFGDTGNATKTVTMGAAVTLDDETTAFATAEVEGALPGEGIDFSVKADLTSTPTEGAFVAMKISATSSDNTNLAAPTITLNDGSTWKLSNGIYYLVTAANADTLKAVSSTEDATLAGSFVLSTALTNDAATDVITITAEISAIQGELFYTEGYKGSDASGVVGNAITNATIADAVELGAFTWATV